jgi:hypothetical protein
MICGASSTIQTVILALSVWISVGFTLSPHLPTTRTFRSNIRTKVVSRSVDDSKINEEISAELKQVKTAREIPGKHKWLGGAVDEEGRIYGVPSNAQEVICLAPNPDDGEGQYEMHTIPLPASIAQGQFKWLRGIIWENYLIGIPAWSQAGVLWVDIGSYWEKKQMNGGVDQNEEGEARSRNENFATVLPLPEGALDSMVDDGVTSERWLWHGAALNHNKTAIYAIPSNAQQVLKIDLRTKTTTLLPIPATVTPLSQTNKWYGGILGDDNAIYGVPYAASGVLRIDANTDTVELIGEDMFGVMEYNWHGGIKHPSNGKIYCFPAHNSHVLAIDTGSSKNDAMSLEERLSLLEIHRAPYDKDEVTRYKWLGGSLGADGNIYGEIANIVFRFVLLFHRFLLNGSLSFTQGCHQMLQQY